MSAPAPAQAPASAEELLTRAADALWKCAKAALTVEPALTQPYEDDRRWSPWTRWVERPAREAHDLAMAIRRHLKGSSPRLAPAAEGRATWEAYESATGDPTNPVSFTVLAPESKELWSAIEARTQAPLRARVTELEALAAAALRTFGKASDGMHATVSDADFASWCDTAGIPLPEGVRCDDAR